LFSGVLLVDWLLSGIFSLPAEVTYLLTGAALKVATAVAVLGLVFARRWLNMTVTLVATGLLSLGLTIWVFSVWYQSPSRHSTSAMSITSTNNQDTYAVTTENSDENGKPVWTLVHGQQLYTIKYDSTCTYQAAVVDCDHALQVGEVFRESNVSIHGGGKVISIVETKGGKDLTHFYEIIRVDVERVTSPSSSTTAPAGQEPKVEAPLANLGPAPPEAKLNPKDGLKYVWIPPGTFMMGCSPGDGECEDDEKPRHKVTITKGFWLGQTEVTVGAYKRFAAATGRQMPPEAGEHGQRVNPGWSDDAMPVVNVTWHDARAYCRWAGGRLPTEAEWEYAARGGSTEAHYGPIGEIAWYADNSGSKPHDVGQKRANGFGLYDMLGNVWEWVLDGHDKDYYKDSASQDPEGPASGGWPVQRGGAWYDEGSGNLRVSRRYCMPPEYIGESDLGFRCAGDVFKASADMTGPTSESTDPAKESSKAKAPMVGPAPAQGNVSTSENIDLLSEFGAKEIGPGRVKAGLNPKDGLKYVWIPAGTFMMGCSPGDNKCVGDEKPTHRVTITRGFWIGQTPVTVGAYKQFVRAAGQEMPHVPDFNKDWLNDNMPIVNVTWYDANAYCRWMGGRLPTEAEWEYAARGGTAGAYYGALDEIAWYKSNSGNPVRDVAKKRPNNFGLYDMLGNVWEWVNDRYGEQYYQNSPSQNPGGPTSGEERVLRGSAWYYISGYVRVSERWKKTPAIADPDFGFRCGGEVFAP
jgi:formylglycine-generating enzyme required for sulfatase activity